LILIAYLAVTIARAASVYPILGISNQLGYKFPVTWSNTAMVGGVRGALSIALAASLGAYTVVSSADAQTITTMVLGVAFLSIVIQSPMMARYVRRRFATQQTLSGDPIP
jgi:NhaP-type Na+/H+ or K+/H+ antiporter